MLMPLEDEVWRPVEGFEGIYEVSNQGRIRSLDRYIPFRRYGKEQKSFVRGTVLKERPDEQERYSVYLCRNGTKTTRKVHQLVLEAFVGPRPKGYEACHKNDVSTDNRLENLYWGTREQNVSDQKRNGKCRNQNTNATHCRRGHPFDEDNTLWLWREARGKYQRRCGACYRVYQESLRVAK